MLGDPDYYGTLAAVRDLGRAGVPVTVADASENVSRSATSRFCSHRVVAPASVFSSEYTAWMLELGGRMPGTFLYPTSDDSAWWMAQRQDALREHFLLHQPSAEATIGLLDKSRLYAHAAAQGVPYPTTYMPTSMDEVRELGETLTRDGGFPVIVKARTQAGLAVKVKGYVAQTASELRAAVDAMRVPGFFVPEFLRDAPADIRWPLVQRYMPEAQRETYSVSGFIDQTGTLRAARASLKIFQIPIRIGVGIAFEGRAVVPKQKAKIEALARATGYFGVFEAEFIHTVDGDHFYLMDFNPRFYGQMNFEISRGLPLPRIVHAAARGAINEVDSMVSESRPTERTDNAADQRFCNQWLFQSLLRAQRIGGRLDRNTHQRWLSWMKTGDVFDFVRAEDDPRPALSDRRQHMWNWMRYPRSSYRNLFR